MSGLDQSIAAAGTGTGVRTRVATVRIPTGSDGAQQAPVVTIDGTAIPVVWLGPTVVEDQDAVLVQINGDGGLSTAIVLDRLTSTAMPQVGTVTAVPSGSQTITVKAAWLGTINAVWVSTYTPKVGDTVMLMWQGSTPVVLGARSSTPAASGPGGGGTGGGGAAGSGVASIRPVEAGVWDESRGGWNSYYGQNLWQGSWGSYGPLRGTLWYGGGAAGVQGKTVTGARVYLGARRRAGNYNANIGLTLALHGQSTRGGNPAPITGGLGFTLPPNWPGGWLTLDTGWGATLASGAGLVMVGGDYIGINGPREDAQSGLLELTWKA